MNYNKLTQMLAFDLERGVVHSFAVGFLVKIIRFDGLISGGGHWYTQCLCEESSAKGGGSQ